MIEERTVSEPATHYSGLSCFANNFITPSLTCVHSCKSALDDHVFNILNVCRILLDALEHHVRGAICRQVLSCVLERYQ